ncbi:MAG: rhombosortase [Proteobacteria bacterium]|nr:rhombosortase [Pseudomonadota bacterium]
MEPLAFVPRIQALLKSCNCDGWRGVALLWLCVLLLLPVPAGQAAIEALGYQRSALAAGQWWRLVSAHWVHLDLHHALLNCAGLVLLWSLFAREYRPRQWLLVLAAGAAAIDAGLWLWDSTVQWYVGSSGVLHGVMAAGTVALLRRRDRTGWLLAAALAGKLFYEQLAGALPLSGSDPVVVDAHLFGAAGGLAAALCLKPVGEWL